ncbi:hypothetical protein HFP15_25015 [Amycolatopsis sp. K13G38]|uniref:Uncharacterized protein n=1 Tax=Amycolatopsis acididurans TaxID=2724524 RepID=A0ABX1J8Z1_9PSEU|nr:hypothetical protein [Amycolatopsis acididurans]NKQ56144.1 hypothetical protein [Amycolatopsis acididurans]
MADWVYEMQLPNDVLADAEMAAYRNLAVETWRTAAEAAGGHPGDPVVALVDADPAAVRADPITGEMPTRIWRVAGPVE